MRAIFFDFFGVLSTTMYTHIINQHLPETERAAWIKKLDLLDLGSLSEDDFVKALSTRLEMSEADLRRQADATPTFNTALFTFIAQTLKPAYVVGLITNVPRGLIERIAAEQLKVFDIVVISSDIHIIKPDPRIFELALRQANCRPEESVFIDDRIKNVEAAQALGMHGLLYTDVPTLKAALHTLLSEN